MYQSLAFIKKETLAQVYFKEHFKNTIFCRTSLVAALKISEAIWTTGILVNLLFHVVSKKTSTNKFP